MWKALIKTFIGPLLAMLIVATTGNMYVVWTFAAYLGYSIIRGLQVAIKKDTYDNARKVVSSMSISKDPDIFYRAMTPAKVINVVANILTALLFVWMLYAYVPVWVLYMSVANTVILANTVNSILNAFVKEIEENMEVNSPGGE